MKNQIYFLKWPLILLFTGLLVRTIGAIIKILHWLAADWILIAGTVIMVVSIIWLLTKLLFLKKENT